MAKHHDAFAYHLLRSIPGVGRILSLVLLYEIENIDRFPRVNEFLSYARLVRAQKSSPGKVLGHSGRAVYVMLKRRQPFDAERFLAST